MHEKNPLRRVFRFGHMSVGGSGCGFVQRRLLMRLCFHEACFAFGRLARPCAGRQSLSLLLQRK
jgi:hypothetical protein